MFYIRIQLSILNAFALIVHKIQSLIMTNIFISLDNSMFVPKHAYIVLSRAQRWNQIFIFALCRETFRVNQQTIVEYERLKGIVKKVYETEINVFDWQFHRVLLIFLRREPLWLFLPHVVSATFFGFSFKIRPCHWYERCLSSAKFPGLILWSWSRVECSETDSSWDNSNFMIGIS